MADFRFTEGDYHNLCDAIQTNDRARFQSIVDAVSDEDRSRFGPTTFCPPPSTKLPSPLVTAAWFNELCCKHLVKVFPNAIDINANGLVYESSVSVYTATALVAACTTRGGMVRKKLLNIGLIKYLVENGANVNQATLDGRTPLTAAALYISNEYMRNEDLKADFWNLFQYFVSKGADVNKTDCHGDNCLLIPICMYGTSVIRYLHNAGVNIDLEHRNAQGYTILHEACRRGMATEYIRNAFQCVSLPLYAPSTDSTHPGYIPCPLYLAAAKGNEANLEELLKIEDCPLEGVADAYLLCGAVKPHGKSAISKGLMLLKEHSIQLSYPPPRPEYDYQVEIKTTEELDAVWGNKDCRNMIYQRALIMERCLGPNSLLFAEILLSWANRLASRKHYTEVERFLEKSVSISLGSTYHPLRSSLDSMPSLSKRRTNEIILFSSIADQMIQTNHIPNFPCFVRYILHIVNHYSSTLFNLILDIFRRWKICNTDQVEFVTLFRSFVDGYAQLSTGSTVLHVILRKKKLPYKYLSDLPVEQLQETFTEAVLEAGCDEFVNCVDEYGQRPLHIIADNKILAKLLIDHGAHMDAVDYQGKPAFPPGTFGVPSLYCTVANAIVQYSLPYQSIGLPPHVVQFVMLHDPLCAVI